MCAAGIVADHSADGAAIMSRRVGRECQLVHFGLVAQGVQHDTRLNARKSLLRINFENLIHVLRKVEDHRDVAALAGQAGARSAGQYRRAVLSAGRYCGDYVFIVTWNYQANGNLTVI